MSGFTIRPRQVEIRAPTPRSRSRSSSRSPSTLRSIDLDFETLCERASMRASQYESQIKELESKLSEELGNFRALDQLLRDTKATLQVTTTRTDHALQIHAPYIQATLDDALDALTELSERLPIIRDQVHQIRMVYDAGRRKAIELVSALAFLNMPMPARYASIIFTPYAPVSRKKKILARTVACCCLVLSSWLAWIVLAGAIRAHRHRLVWGERLMS
ncbi:hypothetical protein PUNSTDRAFT_54307 [Punctularia strigosozonata HHB-11173 SS5]|uniref:uncharacterized protein n=1 Tax=Punctularia strigosozonata (strain HHB-11173) TaxID=741275 RepID=UPI0004416D62|nr:uncharacterized protein PUNSTDRAFT_54307 [Punctularia strigosozonata HHB-11173 SS5]EIN05994.1 hypothetical protein PUNSTDRAFT_54307 [Punctularia strigosozonata HHB-11173 SS5]